MLKRWIVYIILDICVCMAALASLILLEYKAGYTCIASYKYTSLSFWMTLIVPITLAIIILLLVIASSLFLFIPKLRKYFKIVLNLLIIIIPFMVINIFYVPPYSFYYLKGFGNAMKEKADLEGIQNWLSETEFEHTDRPVEIDLQDTPEQIKALNPMFVYVDASEKSKEVQLTYGRGMQKLFGVTILSTKTADHYTYMDCKDCAFEQINDYAVVWQSEPCNSGRFHEIVNKLLFE